MLSAGVIDEPLLLMKVNWNVVASPAILAALITLDNKANLDVGVRCQASDLVRQ